MAEFTIRTTELIAGGDALGRLPDGRAVFVADGAPDELVRIGLTQETARWARARILDIPEPSPHRIVPPYPKELLGGATWSHLDYQAQLRAKEQILGTTLARIGGQAGLAIQPIVASPAQWGYRNRVAYTFGGQGERVTLGTLAPGSDSVVEPADGSALFGAAAETLLRRVSAWTDAAPRTAWSPRGNRQGLRTVIFRRSIHADELLVHLVATSGIAPDPSLAGCFEGLPVTGIAWSANDARDTVLRIDRTTVLAGNRLLAEQVGPLAVSYDVTSFFQANVEAAALLLAELRSHLAGAAAVVDLYAGVGLMGFGAAGTMTPLTLVESQPQAIEDAKRNARRLDRHADTLVAAGTAAGYLAGHPLPPDGTVIVDPPRTGLESSVVQHLLRDQPAQIAYVSCDPATLARDLKLLSAAYRPGFIRPFDFFPQTPHIETLVILERHGG